MTMYVSLVRGNFVNVESVLVMNNIIFFTLINIYSVKKLELN